MSDIYGKRFDVAKENLRGFSNNQIEFQPVETSAGLFGLFDHKVTGDELNEFVKKIRSI